MQTQTQSQNEQLKQAIEDLQAFVCSACKTYFTSFDHVDQNYFMTTVEPEIEFKHISCLN